MDIKKVNQLLWSTVLYQFNASNKILFLAEVAINKLRRPIAHSICNVRGHKPTSQKIRNIRLVYCMRCGDILIIRKE